MNKFIQNNIATIITVSLTGFLALVAIFTAVKLYQLQNDSTKLTQNSNYLPPSTIPPLKTAAVLDSSDVNTACEPLVFTLGEATESLTSPSPLALATTTPKPTTKPTIKPTATPLATIKPTATPVPTATTSPVSQLPEAGATLP